MIYPKQSIDLHKRLRNNRKLQFFLPLLSFRSIRAREEASMEKSRKYIFSYNNSFVYSINLYLLYSVCKQQTVQCSMPLSTVGLASSCTHIMLKYIPYISTFAVHDYYYHAFTSKYGGGFHLKKILKHESVQESKQT